MKEMNIEYLDLSEIKPYENNPRDNDGAVDYVANSIKEFGFKVPIIIDENNVIVAGHTRLKAAKKLGLEKAPCIRADDLSEKQIRAFRLADNKVGEIATWDLDKLNVELGDLDFDMGEFGFGDFDNVIEEGDGPGGAGTEPNFNYKEQYGVIVMCKSEGEQELVYTRLVGEGFECKVVTT